MDFFINHLDVESITLVLGHFLKQDTFFKTRLNDLSFLRR